MKAQLASFGAAKGEIMRFRRIIPILCVVATTPLQLAFAQTYTFNFVGEPQTWVVPNNVTSIVVDARGAQGGGSAGDPKVTGGKGGRAQTTLAVTPGETLVIYVGGRGGELTPPNTGGLGGFNGGGTGGIDNVDFNGPAEGGGGASDVRQGGNDLSHRVVVAGGGGGAECCEDANGGDGGGTVGVTGATSGGGSSPGVGGTQSNGGAGGTGCDGNGSSGSLGQGGNGGDGNRAGGGGGGGYYGGGGGGGCLFGAGGGGGSSYSAGTDTIHTQGYQTGDGEVIITVGQSQTTHWKWSELATNGGPVSGRENPGAVYDPTSNRLIVFGGLSLDEPCCDNSLNETWVLTNANGTGGTPTWIQLAPNAPSGLPQARTDLSAVYDSANNRMIIFGGGQFGPSVFHALFNDVWVLTNANGLGGTPTWVPLAPTGGPPPARAGHEAIYDAQNNRMVVYGGGNNGIENVPTDVWVLTNANGLGGPSTWLQFSPGGNPPVEEHYATGYDPSTNRMIFFGGCCFYTNASTALTNADGIGGTPQWILLSPGGTVPAIRQTPAYGYNPADNSLLIFGVSGPSTPYNDTWELLDANGAAGTPSWVNLIPNGDPNSPPIISGFNTSSASGFDVANRRLISLENTPVSGGNTVLQAWVLAPTPTLPPPLNSTFGVGDTSSNPTTTTSEPINTATGDYYLSHSDVVVPGKGLAFNFTRSYNSLDSYNGPLGAAWTHTFNILLSVNAASGNVSIKEPDGHQDLFTSLGGGVYMAGLTGLYDHLTGNLDGSFTLTRKNQTRLNFSTGGVLTSIVDRNGNTQVLNYDGSGHLASVVDPAGRTFTFAYDGSGRITSLSDPVGRSWTYGYDPNGNLASTTDAAGAVTQYTYDANHRMLTAIDARGVTFLQNTYDNEGRVVTQTNARNFVTTLAYNSPTIGTTTFTDPLGNATQHVYDGALRLIKMIDAKGGTISYAYDANNDRTAITNQNGNTINMAYDGVGNVTSITDPLGDVQSFTYDSKNDLLTAANPKGATTNFSYDSNGNLVGIKDAAGNTTSFAYSAAGLLTSRTDARANASSYAYDSAGDLNRVTDALGNVTTLTYDAVGRLLTTTDPNGHSASVTYDAVSRIVKTTDALNNSSQFFYDGIGNLLKITDANGNSTSYAYDGTNNLTGVTDALSQVTSYGYDANNNRTSFTNAKGNITSYAFDPLNRLTKITDPLSFTTSYAYDAVGNTISTTDANGKTNQYAYDVLNRLIKGAYADGSSVNYAYDQDGNRTTMTDSRGNTNYIYDALDRVLSVTSPSGAVMQYGFDAAGNRTSLTYPDGRTVQYQYDALNRLFHVTDWANKTTQYSYDPAGVLSGFTYPNGAASTYTFDAANRLLEIVNRSGSNVLSSFTYALDKAGNRVQVTSAAGGTTKYGYDPLYRLTSWTAPSGQATQYVYDPVGNRLSMSSSAGNTSYTYDTDDRMLTAGSSSYGYDKNGNQISKVTGSTTVSYSYDVLNHLITASGGGINSQYQYDGDGNRVAQIVPTGTYQYLNDTATNLPAVLNEAGPDGNIDYLYGLSMISETSPAFQYFYQSDGLGSTSNLTDATGALKASYSYDPWGKLLVPVDPLGTKNKYKFTGEALDPGTGLYFLRARYYESASSRLTSSDPRRVSRGRSSNLYVYADNDPLYYADPTGLNFFSDLWNSTQSGLWAVGFGAVTISSGIAQTANTLTFSKVPILNTAASVLSQAQQDAAAEILTTTESALHVHLSTGDFQTDVKIITTLGNLTNDVGGLFSGITDIRNLQNTINVDSLLGQPITWAVVQQAWATVDATLSGIGVAQDIAQFLPIGSTRNGGK